MLVQPMTALLSRAVWVELSTAVPKTRDRTAALYFISLFVIRIITVVNYITIKTCIMAINLRGCECESFAFESEFKSESFGFEFESESFESEFESKSSTVGLE